MACGLVLFQERTSKWHLLKRNVPRVQIVICTMGSIVNRIWGEGLSVHLISTKIFTLTMNKIFIRGSKFMREVATPQFRFAKLLMPPCGHSCPHVSDSKPWPGKLAATPCPQLWPNCPAPSWPLIPKGCPLSLRAPQKRVVASANPAQDGCPPSQYFITSY